MTATWEQLTESRGGTVSALLWCERSGVLAATAAGIFASSDAGATWDRAAGSTVPFATVLGRSGGALYAGAADGLYRSVSPDGDWQRVLVGSGVHALATTADMILAGTQDDGILMSDNGGRTWRGANAGLRESSVLSLALSPDFDRDHLGFAGTSSGLYRSRSGGQAWRAVDGLQSRAVQCITCPPWLEDRRCVFAGTEEDGLFRSEDGGSSWQPARGLERRSITGLAFDGHHCIAAATECGVAISRDAGQTWHVTGLELGPVLTVTISPDGTVLLAGLPRRGLARSEDGGRTWSPANQGLHAQPVLGLLALDSALVTFGPEQSVRMSTDSGRTWSDRNQGLEHATVLGLAEDGGVLFAATTHGVYCSEDAGQTWQPEHTEHCVRIAARDGLIVAASASGRLMARRAGTPWETLPPPGAVTDQLLALTVSENSIFAGCVHAGGSTIWRWSDTPGIWELWFQTADVGNICLALPFASVAGRVWSPIPNVYDVSAGQRRPAWRSADVGGPGETTHITALLAGPPQPHGRTVLAGTNAGVLKSRDAGRTFLKWQTGMSGEAVVALALSPAFLQDGWVYALILGGGVWRRRVVAATR